METQASYQPSSDPLRGLGVGLCLATMYTTHFGGSISIKSDGRNRGTTVTINIPRDIDIVESI